MPLSRARLVPVAVLAALLGACGPTSHPQPSPTGTVTEVLFTSNALGVEKRYRVYLPAGYDGSQERYPTVYLLHGLGGDETDFTRLGNADGTADNMQLQAILVMPDGDDSFYVDWATPADYDACQKTTRPWGRPELVASYCVHQARYEQYIVRDLVSDVDARFRTVQDRRARALGGVSMGGYAALALGLRHADLFSSIGAHSPVGSLLYLGPHPYVAGGAQLAADPQQVNDSGYLGAYMFPLFGADLSNWLAHEPATLASQLQPGLVSIYFDVGDVDELNLQDSTQYLDDALKLAGVPHTFVLGQGGDDWDFWRAQLPTSLAFHVTQFRAAGF